MGYGANKEDVRKAFINNFGYDKNIQLYDRTFFSKEWTDLLKTELAAQRPVYYEGGSGENNQPINGHLFAMAIIGADFSI